MLLVMTLSSHSFLEGILCIQKCRDHIGGRMGCLGPSGCTGNNQNAIEPVDVIPRDHPGLIKL